MFCRNCGNEIPEDAKFCTHCGALIEGEPVSNEVAVQEAKMEIRSYLTPENVERFAPLAVFLPVIMRIVLGGVFVNLRWIPIVGSLLYFILKLLFAVAAGACAYGLAQSVVNSGKQNEKSAWIVPGAVAVATLLCVVRLFGGRVPFVFAHDSALWAFLETACFLLGLDFLARITINRQPLNSPIDVEADIVTYRTFWQEYRAKNPTTVELEKQGYVDPEKSYFDGSGMELFGLSVLTAIVCVVTCGIATPWMLCKLYQWRLSHTVINDRRLTFTGTGSELLGKWILWELLCIVTCGIYAFFMVVALYKWEAQHTFMVDEAVLPGEQASNFDGNSLQYLGYSLLWFFLLLMTCGLAFPWVMTMKQTWYSKHMIINGRRLKYSGTGLGLLGEYLIIMVLTVVTCGLYGAWGMVRMNKYIVRNTDLD